MQFGRQRGVVRTVHLDDAGIVDGARFLLEVGEACQWQRLERGFFLLIHLQHLTLLAAVNARCSPAFFPVGQPLILCIDGFEPTTFQRRVLRMLDRRLDRTLSIRIGDATRIGDCAVVRQQCRIDGIELRLVQVRPDHALLKIVEHDIRHASTKTAEGFFVQACPGFLIGLPHRLAEALAGVLERHDKQVRATVLPGGVPCHRAQAEVDLRLFARQTLKHVEAFGLAHLERAHEALDRVVAVGEAVRLDQILVDALRVAAQLHLRLDEFRVCRARRHRRLRRSRWPGWRNLVSRCT